MRSENERTTEPNASTHAETLFPRGLATILCLDVHVNLGALDSIRLTTFVNLVRLPAVAFHFTDQPSAESFATRVDRSPNRRALPQALELDGAAGGDGGSGTERGTSLMRGDRRPTGLVIGARHNNRFEQNPALIVTEHLRRSMAPFLLALTGTSIAPPGSAQPGR